MENIFPLFTGDLGNPVHADARETWLPIMALCTRQSTLNPARLKATNDRGLPQVWCTPRGDHVIIDGNHRCAFAILAGMRMYIKCQLTPTRY